MCDLYVPDEGCSVVTIDWLNELSVVLIYTQEAFEEFRHVNDLTDSIGADCWEGNTGTSIRLTCTGEVYFVAIFSSIDTNTIVHECVHLVDYILDDTAIPISIENTEVRAYMTEFLYAQICEELEVTIGLGVEYDPISEELECDFDLQDEEEGTTDEG